MAYPRTSDSPTTTVRLERALLDDIALLGKKEKRSLVGQVAFVLEKYRDEHAEILAALKKAQR